MRVSKTRLDEKLDQDSDIQNKPQVCIITGTVDMDVRNDDGIELSW